ncbi:hypothetical protein Tco_0237156 [Tanacetum coccineum]
MKMHAKSLVRVDLSDYDSEIVIHRERQNVVCLCYKQKELEARKTRNIKNEVLEECWLKMLKSRGRIRMEKVGTSVADGTLSLQWLGVGLPVMADLRTVIMHEYVGPFKVLGKVGEVAYKLELPEELSRVHNTFHVSNLKKCYVDEPLAVPLDGLHFDDKLQFVEEPVEILDREVKRLNRSRIPLFKVRWNSKRGPELT